MAIVYTETEISTIGGDQIKLSVRGSKALVAFNNSNTLYVQVASLGETTIDSFGTEASVTTNSGTTEFSFDVVLLSDTRGVVIYEDTVAGDIKGKVLTISGTTVTPETERNVVSGADELDVAYVNSTRVLLVYDAGSNDVSGRVLDIGATTITANSAVPIETGVKNQRVAAIDNDRVIFACVDSSAASEEDIIYRVLYDITTTFSVGSPETSDTIFDVVGEYSIFLHYRDGKAIYTIVRGTDSSFYVQAASVSGNSVTSGSKVEKTTVNTPTGKTGLAPVVIDSTRALAYYKENTESYVDDLEISGETLAFAGNDDNFVSGTNSWVVDFDFYEGDRAVIVYSNQSQVNMAIVESGLEISSTFYFGLGVLQSQFNFPFRVAPKGMTLDKSLGTVVLGSKGGNAPQIIYSNHPYPTGTATADGFPTGVAITALRWI